MYISHSNLHNPTIHKTIPTSLANPTHRINERQGSPKTP
jgi:hypothetical protein